MREDLWESEKLEKKKGQRDVGEKKKKIIDETCGTVGEREKYIYIYFFF
jgi:hypothetical protein